jgi:hypothetical protein
MCTRSTSSWPVTRIRRVTGFWRRTICSTRNTTSGSCARCNHSARSPRSSVATSLCRVMTSTSRTRAASATAEATDGGSGDGGDVAERFETRREERPREDYRPREDTRSSEQRARDDRGQGDRYQGDRGASDRMASDRPASDRTAFERSQSDRTTPERSQNDRSQQDRSSGDRSNRSTREERPRYSRDDRSRGEPRAELAERPTADAMTVVEPQATPLPAPVAAPAPGNMLRADDGDVSHAPAFLQVRPAETREEGAAEPRRPRRRRTPAGFEKSESPTTAAVPTSEEV